MKIRVATEADLPAIAAVEYRTWPPTYEPFAGKDFVERGLASWWSEDVVRRGLPRTLVA